MTPVLTAAECRAADLAVIDGLGIPAIALMEVAAHGVIAAITAFHRAEAERGLVVATGPGNNGGDGWAIARLAHARGWPVHVWAVDVPGSEDARRMAEAARRAGVSTIDGPEGASLLVDAVLGTGVRQPVAGAREEALRRLAGAQAPRVAVDLPSGLCADTGQCLGPVPRAVRTVTLGAAKRGLFSGEGRDLAGQLTVVDLGFGSVLSRPGAVAFVGPPDRWPRRRSGAHKRTGGHLGVWAGSARMSGAAVLCCRAALASGVGLVTLASAGRRPSRLPPEVMWVSTGRGGVSTEAPEWAGPSAWVVGPGLGGGEPLSSELRAAVLAAWHTCPSPMVFDADALLPEAGAAGGPRVITPHAGEAARLLGVTAADVERDRFGTVLSLARPSVVALLKGPCTLVADGLNPIRVNSTGGPVLASGGTGDVLAGVIGALLAARLPPLSAASLGAWAHGRAGDLLAEKRRVGWTASDVIRTLPLAAEEA